MALKTGLTIPDANAFDALIASGGKLRVKAGFDPTAPDLHLGHAVILRKLRQFQDIGCKVVFLIGDFTAQIGDPTGKNKMRPELHQLEVRENMKTYLDQIQFGNILLTDEKHFSWIMNSDWFASVEDIIADSSKDIILGQVATTSGISNLEVAPDSFLGKAKIYQDSRMQLNILKRGRSEGITLINLMSILRHITYAQLIQRDMFQERIRKGEELYMHEMLYPILQGVDSFVLSKIYGSCDVEIGGTDQTFNMLMGRDVMKAAGKSEQAVISMKILRGTDGKNKMSKSLDNYISITDKSDEMFGKIMSLPDDLIDEYFELCTYLNEPDITDIKRMSNPRDQKVALAKEIINLYWGPMETHKAGDLAAENFDKIFRKKETPTDIEVFETDKKVYPVLDLLCDTKLAPSKNEARRLVEGGAITVIASETKQSKINNWKEEITLENDMVIQAGKRKFVKIKLK